MAEISKIQKMIPPDRGKSASARRGQHEFKFHNVAKLTQNWNRVRLKRMDYAKIIPSSIPRKGDWDNFGATQKLRRTNRRSACA